MNENAWINRWSNEQIRAMLIEQLVNSVGFHFSPNIGKRMENVVFLALRQKTNHINNYTAKRDYEVDFYLPETRKLIQVSQRLENSSTREREFRGIEEAAQGVNVDEALILTEADGGIQTLGKFQLNFARSPHGF